VQRNGASVFTADVTIGDERDDGSIDGSGVFVVTADDNSVESIGDAWRTGWDVFVGAWFAIGFVLAVAAPFAVAVVLGAIWLATRRRRHADPTGPQAQPGSAANDTIAATEAVTPDEQLAGPNPRR